ncbi:hypothetical protein [Photobacterium angustum]|uniref:Tail fiber assembly protein n=1 Tax=Photobacterium angustum TaxID=661 RepID=A0A855SEN0_PHOAN|nr:hypothetical protein [Photobacterium angustum]KJF83554.1 hypothetical protein UB36_03195 [Photobacterium damselae subsp. damselae]KJG42582.1 hypothetical protein UA35_00865 [Photobacterium angustum]KJG47862.1 hypothetical protein UA31_03195 [Photobacterium angustum]KJG49882.1 hypothetical protein UA30_05000 [Photobacterium angustum]KJG54026.1 hypothetical protein UA34_07155 [Photobacterium angustum]
MNYWQFDAETKEVNQLALTAKYRGGIFHVPKNSITVKPLPLKDGFAVIVNDELSETYYVEDNRGKTIFNTVDGTSKTVSDLGAIPSGYTLKPRPNQFAEWVNDDWVTNADDKYQFDYNQVDTTRRALYAEQVDPLLAEAAVKKAMGLDQESADFIQQALALRAKIQKENPFPEPVSHG